MPETETEILNRILTEAGKAAATGAGAAIGAKVYKELKEQFDRIWYTNGFEKKFGFPSDVRLAKEIYNTEKTASFKVLVECVGGDHWALNFVQVGIYISSLSDRGEREKINSQRENIKKTKGSRPLNVVNMGSTGAINGVINYLDELRKNGSFKTALVEEFNRIIHDWERITIFVDRNHAKELIKQKVKEKILARLPLFFIFSYGLDASDTASYSISELRKEGSIEPKDYIFDSYPHFDGVGTKVYMWSFELCPPKSSMDETPEVKTDAESILLN